MGPAAFSTLATTIADLANTYFGVTGFRPWDVNVITSLCLCDGVTERFHWSAMIDRGMPGEEFCGEPEDSFDAALPGLEEALRYAIEAKSKGLKNHMRPEKHSNRA